MDVGATAGQLRVFGHQHGVKAVRTRPKRAAELGIKFLTLYAFSTENWNRPPRKKSTPDGIAHPHDPPEKETLNKNKIRLQAIGDMDALPPKCREELNAAIRDTATNDRMTLILALSYSSKWELSRAMRLIAEDVKAGRLDPASISEEHIADRLCAWDFPDPELDPNQRRTSDQQLPLWQIAYAEFYFTDKLWPEFGKETSMPLLPTTNPANDDSVSSASNSNNL